MTDKVCCACKVAKDVSEYNKKKTTKDGLQYKCRDCDKASKRGRLYKDTLREYYNQNKSKLNTDNAKWAKENKEQVLEHKRRERYKSKYGLTIEQFDSMRRLQDYCCYICKVHEDEEHLEVLNVDHDHDTGLVRKLLCSNCNKGLGFFMDSPGLLKKATEYLSEHGKS